MDGPAPSTNLSWHETSSHSGLVPIRSGAVQLSVAVSGQPRPSQGPCPPLVILAAGLGGVAAEWIAVAELIGSFARVLRFDRAGYGASTTDSTDQVGDTTGIPMSRGAEDLSLALATMKMPPPYVIVGQSLGGLLAREFLRQRGSVDVVGLVLVDSFPIRPFQSLGPMRPLIRALCGDTPWEVVNGSQRNSVLSQQQRNDVSRDVAIAEKNGTMLSELQAALQSESSINEAQGLISVIGKDGLISDIAFSSPQLDRGRLSLIIGDSTKDVEAALEFGRAHGNGDEKVYLKTEEIIGLMRNTVTKFQKAQSGLTSGDVHIRMATGTGMTHDLHLTRPDIVAEEIKWVLEGCARSEDVS